MLTIGDDGSGGLGLFQLFAERKERAGEPGDGCKRESSLGQENGSAIGRANIASQLVPTEFAVFLVLQGLRKYRDMFGQRPAGLAAGKGQKSGTIHGHTSEGLQFPAKNERGTPAGVGSPAGRCYGHRGSAGVGKEECHRFDDIAFCSCLTLGVT